METTAATRTPGEIVRDVFSAIFDAHDLSDPYRYWTDDSVDYFLAAGMTVRGARDLAEFFRNLFAAVPDWRLEIQNVVDDGDRQAVVQWLGTGTFDGREPMFGIEPNGRRIEIPGCDVIRFDADGKIDVNTVYYDGAEFARQIGMLPRRDSAADRGMLAAFNAGTRLKQRLRSRG